MSTVAQCLQQAVIRLQQSDSARLDAELLLCETLRKPRSYLIAYPEHLLEPAQQQQFEALLQRRIAGEPVAYLLGRRGFWTLDLEVNEATLIPRPETELLVQQAFSKMTQPRGRLLDLGTGSGAIALALASEKPQWQIDAVDLSEQALAIARGNADRHGLPNVTFLVSDWFTAIGADKYDIIVSNPPYIDRDDPHLQQGDVRFEPHTALVAEQQGMAALAHIIDRAPEFLKAGGWLFCEHGYQQAVAVRGCLEAAGFTEILCLQDLAGQDRVSGGCWSANNG